jgi:hypothetical protein
MVFAYALAPLWNGWKSIYNNSGEGTETRLEARAFLIKYM